MGATFSGAPHLSDDADARRCRDVIVPAEACRLASPAAAALAARLSPAFADVTENRSACALRSRYSPKLC